MNSIFSGCLVVHSQLLHAKEETFTQVFHDAPMQQYRIWHRIALTLSILALITITYTTILVSNFKTPEATANFFQQSNVYYYIAEIIKTDIRSKYSPKLQTNIIELAVADRLLNAVVTPNLVERLSLPVLRARQKIAQLPLSFAENNLVLNTSQYTKQLSNTISSLQLPSALMDAGQNLIAAVPAQVTVIDVQKNPNSMLVAITQIKIIFMNIQKIITISWVVLILSLVILFVSNIKFFQRMIQGFIWIFAVSGIVLLFFSFMAPLLADAFSSNPDPIAGVLKDQLINSMITYYFSLTRTTSIVFLGIGIALFLVHHFVPFPKVQAWITSHILTQPTPSSSSTKPRKRKLM